MSYIKLKLWCLIERIDINLSMFVNVKLEKLTLDMTKYDIEYVYQREKLTLEMSKYDFEYVCKRKI
jgi:hypothetical protein